MVVVETEYVDEDYLLDFKKFLFKKFRAEEMYYREGTLLLKCHERSRIGEQPLRSLIDKKIE